MNGYKPVSSHDIPYFQKSKKMLHSHWLRAAIHSPQMCIHWGLCRYVGVKTLWVQK